MKVSFAKQILAGKTLARFFFNRELARAAGSLHGQVLDLAGGDGSYVPFLPQDIDLLRTDLRSGQSLKRADFNQPLLFEDASFDHVLFFNAIYIAEDPATVLQEIRRVLKPNGTLLLSSPFMQNEMREPHDYRRLTREGLEQLFTNAGFRHSEIVAYGERFSVGANLLHAFWLFSAIRLAVYATARALDRAIPAAVRLNHPAPLGYFCTASI